MSKWHVTVSGTFTEVYEIEAETAQEAQSKYRTGRASELDKVSEYGQEWIEEVSGV